MTIAQRVRHFGAKLSNTRAGKNLYLLNAIGEEGSDTKIAVTAASEDAALRKAWPLVETLSEGVVCIDPVRRIEAVR
jgi:hypothetical protein